MKVIIAGSRYIESLDIDPIIKESGFFITEVIEGGARGVDRIARNWAIDNSIPYKTFDAKWEEYGLKAAGPIRNRQMAEYGEALIAIPLSYAVNKGTRGMIAIAKNLGLPVFVHEVNQV